MSDDANERGTDDKILQDLRQEVLDTIRNIKPHLEPIQAMLLGAGAGPILAKWGSLERRVSAAKLAIVRDEFSVRFPNFCQLTEGFTFGIVDANSDRYLTYLKPRQKGDIFNMTVAIIEEVFGPHPRIPGIAHFTSNLTQALQAYSRNVEQKLHPFAVKIGYPG